MSTSGTATFNMDLSELVEEAFERCGSELRSGYDLKTARRSLNILTAEWANKGINLWTIDQGSIPLITGTATYDLPADTIDLLDQVVRTGTGTTQVDINLSRISSTTFATIPTKNTTGRPVQIWINRQAQIPQVTVWPIPFAAYSGTGFVNTTTVMSCASIGAGVGFAISPLTFTSTNNMLVVASFGAITGGSGYTDGTYTAVPLTYVSGSIATSYPVVDIVVAGGVVTSCVIHAGPYTLVYWRLRRIQDAGTGVNTQDIPFRFLPAMIAGLAFHLSLKLPGVDPNRVMGLKAMYDEAFQTASEEDREKSSYHATPRIYR